LAEVITAVKYDLPKPEGWDEWKRKKEEGRRKKEEGGSGQAKSKPVKPSPTGSDQDGTGQTSQSNPVAPDLEAERTPDSASEGQSPMR
jgi:hypothetical protein